VACDLKNKLFLALSIREDPLPIVQEAGWAPGLVWMDGENLTPHRESILGLSIP